MKQPPLMLWNGIWIRIAMDSETQPPVKLPAIRPLTTSVIQMTAMTPTIRSIRVPLNCATVSSTPVGRPSPLTKPMMMGMDTSSVSSIQTVGTAPPSTAEKTVMIQTRCCFRPNNGTPIWTAMGLGTPQLRLPPVFNHQTLY